jgi:cysteine synthase A
MKGRKNDMLSAIGSTPLVRLSRIVPKGAADVWVKLEYYNPTGSYKDRMALSMIERAESRGDLKPGMTVVEYTGGSTGISLAFVCAVKGYRCRIVCNDAVAAEKRRSMEVFGAELEVLKSDGGKLTPDLVPRMMARAREIAAEGPSYATTRCAIPTWWPATSRSARSCYGKWVARFTLFVARSARRGC